MVEEKKKDLLMIFTFASLALSLVSTITYMIYSIINNGSFLDHLVSTLGVIILAVFAIILVVTGFFIENKTAKIFIIIASLLLTIYSICQLIININSKNIELPDFTNYDIKEVTKWAKDNKIELVQEYQYNDKVDKFHVISQDPTSKNIKKTEKLKVIISNGIDTTKITKVDDMTGWKLDDVIKFIDENKLTNVTINFVYSNTVPKDTIIFQDVIKEITRNEPITLTSSLGKESERKSIVIENLVGMDTFHATLFLKRNDIKYKIDYTFDSEKEDVVLNQSIKALTVLNPNKKEEMILTIAKADKITVPNLSEMTVDEIDNWATKNRIIVNYKEEYDENIKMNKIISYSCIVGSNIDVGSSVEIVVSKGPLRMIDFTNVSDFEEWAKENNVSYSIRYEYSDKISQGKVIEASHSKNDIIKNNDTVKLIISEGSNTTIPNLIGLEIDEAKNECENNKIKCTFVYINDNKEFKKVIKQSMKAKSIVPTNTSITVTIGE